MVAKYAKPARGRRAEDELAKLRAALEKLSAENARLRAELADATAVAPSSSGTSEYEEDLESIVSHGTVIDGQLRDLSAQLDECHAALHRVTGERDDALAKLKATELKLADCVDKNTELANALEELQKCFFGMPLHTFFIMCRRLEVKHKCYITYRSGACQC